MRPGAALYALWAWLFAGLGVSIAVLGPAIPAIRADFSLSLVMAGALFSVHSAGYFAGVLYAGPLADRRGRRAATAWGVAGLVAGMAVAAAAPSWAVFLAGMAVAGWGFAFVDVGLNAAIADAPGSARRRAATMNLLHGAFPLGTLVAPAGLALAWQVGLGWRAAFVAIAGVVAVSLVPLALRVRWPSRPSRPSRPAVSAVESAEPGPAPLVAEAAGTMRSLASTLREPRLVRLAAVQGLYVGVELGIAGWLATYLIETFGATDAAGALATSLYWAGFLLGRPAMAWLTHRFEPGRVLVTLIGLAMLTASGGIVAPDASLAVAAYFATGALISGVFPTVMALALEDRRGDAGAVAALITAAASLGGLTWPWLVGAVAGTVGLRPAMAAAALPLAVMLPLTLSARRTVAGLPHGAARPRSTAPVDSSL